MADAAFFYLCVWLVFPPLIVRRVTLPCCFIEVNSSRGGVVSCGVASPAKRLMAALRPVSSRLSLYTLDCLLIVEQIPAPEPDTVLTARKGLTGLS